MFDCRSEKPLIRAVICATSLLLRRQRQQFARGRAAVFVEGDQRRAVAVLDHSIGKDPRVDAAVPDADDDGRPRLCRLEDDVARRPDIGLGNLVRCEVARERVDQGRLERQHGGIGQPGVHQRRREVGADRSAPVDDRLHHLARLAEDERLADQLGARLGPLDVVLDDRVGQGRQLALDRLGDALAVALARRTVRLGCQRHRLQAQEGDQLVSGLVLERPKLLDAGERAVVASVEVVERRELADQAALRPLVRNLVGRQHGLTSRRTAVANGAKRSGERTTSSTLPSMR
jgi:hypothetical protein